jgi:Ribonuclease G/E
VLGESNHECIISNNGVCKQCFSTIERINKAEKEVEELQKEIKTSRSLVRQKYQLATPSPTKTKIEKRLRSVISPEKQMLKKGGHFLLLLAKLNW